MGLVGYAGIPGSDKAQLGYANEAAQCQPAQVSQVTQAAERHAKAISYLDDRLKVLQSRLGAVLRPATPRPESGNKTVEQHKPLAPFAEGLNQLSAAMERIGNDVEDILNRLEL